MFFEGILLKDALRNVSIILWQSQSSASMVLVLQKDLGLFVSIISSKVQFKVLKTSFRIYYVGLGKSINEVP